MTTNNNFNVGFEFIGGASYSTLNNYISRVEARHHDWRTERLKASTSSAMGFSEAFLITFGLAVLGTGDTNGGRRLLNQLLQIDPKDLLLRVNLLGETVVFALKKVSLISIAADAKSSNMDFVLRVEIVPNTVEVA